MKKTSIILAACVALVLLLGGGYWFLRGDRDEKIINGNLAELVELAEKEGNESVFVTLGDSREIMRYIGTEPQVKLGAPIPVVTDREELEGIIIQIRQALQSLALRIVRNELVVAEDGQSAQMELDVEGDVAQAGEEGRERRHFSIGWVKEEGDWLIQTVQQDEPLYP